LPVEIKKHKRGEEGRNMKTVFYPPLESIEPAKQESGKRAATVWGDGMLNVHRERRAFDRVPTHMEARFMCGNRYYAGNITDVSEKGMFINTDIRLPGNSTLDIIMLIDNEIAIVPVTVRRNVEALFRSDDISSGGMGVELMKSPATYLRYVSGLKSAA
jgi:hypothetical protein